MSLLIKRNCYHLVSSVPCCLLFEAEGNEEQLLPHEFFGTQRVERSNVPTPLLSPSPEPKVNLLSKEEGQRAGRS